MTDTYYTERNHLTARVRDVSWTKEQEFVKQFNLMVDPTPRTYKALIDAIKNDKFKLDTKRTKNIDSTIDAFDVEHFYGSPFDGIIWTDGPEPDHDGYDASMKDMQKRKQAALDIIKTQDPAAGLKALQDFEAWMPEGKAN